ncbi:siderophore-interacting protein [Flavobacterium sharifuzzamanii]|uniref:siderophore-interacting protein n=1 Tax=Flavobacterium sharifuzzamanii TaxID=2211133 RepID=UPI000DAC909B|nr:siderophore-interacting protein [Flavobacterium sharifuzzamanii]KAF2080691.1 siderophore-interacting protein [Flavobacterium sharifuzzamanii]
MDKPIRNTARSLFVVKEKVFITPHYIRITFIMSDEQVNLFQNMRSGSNNKIYIPSETAMYCNDYEESIWNSDFFIAMRTYTTRNIDLINKTLQIDFVAHGDNGPASKWAENAKSGDFLGIAMKESQKPLVPSSENYFIVGDSTAIPVISVILESLTSTSNVMLLLEVSSYRDVFVLNTKAHLNVKWIYNPSPLDGSKLAEECIALLDKEKQQYAFAAAEFETIQKIKKHLKEELQLERDCFYAVSYWKRGSSEEESNQERQKQRME